MAYLLAAYSISGDSSYLTDVMTLGQQYNYFLNALNIRINIPDDYNFSDDELQYLAYLCYWNAIRVIKGKGLYLPPIIEETLQLSMTRSWQEVSKQKSCFYTMVQAMAVPQSVSEEDLANALYDMQQWPTELIDWPYDNSVRDDYQLDTSPGGNPNRSVKVFPPSERSNLKWNSDVFQLTGGSGYSEDTPAAFLVAYYMGRYFKLVSEPGGGL